MNFVVRTHRLPIVGVEFPSFFDEAQYRELFARYRSLSLEHGRIAYIIDMRKFNPLKASAALRKQAAEVFNENVSHLVTATVCEARIVSDQLTRGVVTAFDWLTGTKWPCRTFTSPSEAEDWVQKQLADGKASPSRILL
jgi:uncharacterized protein YbbC (DUF1343 family)